MPKASRDGAVVAESEQTIFLEGNHYFPSDSVDWDRLTKSSRSTVCHWKGVATYYDVEVDGKVIKNAGWSYHTPSEAASGIKDYVAFYRRIAFWGKVKIED